MSIFKTFTHNGKIFIEDAPCFRVLKNFKFNKKLPFIKNNYL